MVPRRVGPEGWSPEGWSPEGWSPERAQKGGGPEGWSPEGWRPKISRFFFLLLGSFRGLKRRGPEMCTFGVLRLLCASPGGLVWWGHRAGRSPIVRGRIGRSRTEHPPVSGLGAEGPAGAGWGAPKGRLGSPEGLGPKPRKRAPKGGSPEGGGPKISRLWLSCGRPTKS